MVDVSQSSALGRECFEYRKRHCLSRAAMAKLCGVHVNTIYHCELGRNLWAVNEGKIERVVFGED